MRVVLVFLVLASGIGWLWLPGVACADAIKITARYFDQEGWPSLLANYTPDGSRATASWSVCASACGPVVATGTVYSPGATVAGTSFQASATVDGTTTTDRSPVWRGQVANIAPPTFDGEPRVGQTLSPHAGTWAGGWGDETSLIGMRACSSSAAQDCRAMTASSWQPGNPSEIIVDPAYAGWYVGAIERLVGWGVAFTAIGYSATPPGQVSSLRAPMPGQTIAAGPLSGPIVAASTPQPAATRLRFTPRVTIRRRAARRGRALKLATVRCSGRCVAHVKLRHGARAISRRIVVTRATAAVNLWPGTFSRRATRVRVSIRFDNHPATASGTVRLR